VVCGSLSIFHGLQGMEHYAGAKGALAAMVKGLAVEMGQYGVRANMIAPGFIMTEMTQGSPQAEGVVKHFSSITPLGRPGYPEDIEGPAAYLASRRVPVPRRGHPHRGRRPHREVALTAPSGAPHASAARAAQRPGPGVGGGFGVSRWPSGPTIIVVWVG
jgi:hypothetical protein